MMKKNILCVIILNLLVSYFLYCQTVYKDTSLIIKTIYFNPNFKFDTLEVDTNVFTLHYLNKEAPEFKFYSHLIRNGNPLISNHISDRLNYQKVYFFPTISVIPYIQSNTNSQYYYYTNKPFSSLTYKFQGSMQSKDEYVQALFTKNISTNSNIGITYRLYSNNSENDFQHANNHSFNSFYAINKNFYSAYYQFFYNAFEFNENGGITNDTLINYKEGDYYGTETNIKDASTKFVHWGFQTIQNIKLFQFLKNDTNNIILSGSILQYNLLFKSNKRFYLKGNPIPSYYQNDYSLPGSKIDSLLMSQLTNLIRIYIPNSNYYLPSFVFNFKHNYFESFHGRNIDTLFFLLPNISWQKHQQLIGNFDINYLFSRFLLQFNFSHNLWGFGKNDYQFSNRTLFKVSAQNQFILNIGISSNTPSFLYRSIFTNYYIWNKGDSLYPIQKQHIGIDFESKSLNLKLTAYLYAIKHHIYFNASGIQQTAGWNSAAEISAQHRWVTNKIIMQNNIYYQGFDKNIFNLPKFMLFHALDYYHTIKFSTGGKLFVNFGYDLKYWSKYDINFYIPSLGVFANNNNSDSYQHLNSYPLLGIHLNFKVKNVSFYIKYSHFNSWWNERQFTTLHYPILPATISYGINWLFYD